MLFPQERPVYPAGEPVGDRAELTVERDEAVCRLWTGGRVFEGRAAMEPTTTEGERGRQEPRAVKMAFYRPALASGIARPPWGALTGVKPGKLMAQYLTAGRTREEFSADFDVSPQRAELCEQTTRAALHAQATMAPEDVGLYVGIPFCPTRCAYCSFISHDVRSSQALIEPYLQALLGEIERVGAAVQRTGQRPVSMYFGGGTPTTLTAPQLEQLCSALEQAFDLRHVREYTVEAGRPDTITMDRLEVLHRHGVTRVSVNPQTMSDSVLEIIGRRHTAQEVVDALTLVRQAGDFQVNMDLIAGLPGDSPAGFRTTLDTVLALRPENITVHTLALKNGSRLSENPAGLPDGDAVGQMVDYAMHELRGAGYVPYYLYRQK